MITPHLQLLNPISQQKEAAHTLLYLNKKGNVIQNRIYINYYYSKMLSMA